MLYSLVAIAFISAVSACDQVVGAQCITALMTGATLSPPTDEAGACDIVTKLMACVSDNGCCGADGVAEGVEQLNKQYESLGFTCTAVCSAAPCFARDTMVNLADGSSIQMSDVVAGDYVQPGPVRVIVNQHANAPALKSSLLTLEHSEGSISLTPDHVLAVNGAFVAAREAVIGSKLGNSEVTRVTASTGSIINPLTTSGMIMADGVLASTYPEWIASYMIGRSTASASSALSFLFPATTQAYYNAALEQFFQSTSPELMRMKAVLPAPVVALIFVVADLALAAGFVAFSLASVKSLVALVGLAAALKSRK